MEIAIVEIMDETTAAEMPAPNEASRGPPSSRSKLNQQIDDALSSLAADLESGRSETLTCYLQAMGKFHRYSSANQLLIWLQNPSATHIAGFHTWKRLGRSVRKGEHGIAIFAPIVFKRLSHEMTHDETDEKSGDVLLEKIHGFKTAYVFDIAQTEGKPLPQFSKVTGDPKSHLPRLKDLITQHGITLTYATSTGGAEGFSSGGKITIRSDLSPAEEFSVLVHEFAHELLHQHKIRDNNHQTSKTIRETQAEAVAFVVCSAINLNTHSASSDYIRLYQGSKETLQESLEAIHRAASVVLSTLDGPKTTGGN